MVDTPTNSHSSIDGIALIGVGAVVLLFQSLITYAAWAAIGYGAWTVWQSRKGATPEKPLG